jgi:hypothetical protein
MKLLVMILFLSTALLPDAYQRHSISIAEVRVLLKEGSDTRGGEYTIKGYFYLSSVPLLVTQPGWMRGNMRMPDSAFIVLGGQWMSENKYRLKEYQGKLLTVKGRLNLGHEQAFGNIVPDFILSAAPQEQ